jgi:adenylylsulfate kinase-like enzyme
MPCTACGRQDHADKDQETFCQTLVGEAAKLMAEAGLSVICSLISPVRAARHTIIHICARDGVASGEGI